MITVPALPLLGDIDGDGRRTVKDVLGLILAILRNPGDSSLDIDGNGTVNLADAVYLARILGEN